MFCEPISGRLVIMYFPMPNYIVYIFIYIFFLYSTIY